MASLESLGAGAAQRDLIRCALYNARRMAKPEYKSKEYWVLAMELWCVGSTMAAELCRLAGVDPWSSKEFKLWTI